MNYSNVAEWLQEKKQVVIVITLVVALVLTTTIISSAVTASEKTTDYYDIKLGGKTIATVRTKDEADKIISGVESFYTLDGEKVINTKFEPSLTADLRQCKQADKTPKLENDTDAIVKHLVTGDVEEKTYEIVDGDTIWDISGNLDISLDDLQAMNNDLDMENIMPGDSIKYQVSEPLVNVITEAEIVEMEEVPFEIETVGTDKLYEDQSQIKEYGEIGSNEVKANVVIKNGNIVKRDVIETKVIKEPKTQIEEKGTLKRPAVSYGGVSYGNPSRSGNGGSIIGTAQSYMGTSYGALNCYQFCAAVYGQYGQGVMDGTAIPFSQAKPGDLLVFDRHHYGIYAGGNSVIHSIHGNGVCCTSIGYVRRVNGGVAYAVSK